MVKLIIINSLKDLKEIQGRKENLYTSIKYSLEHRVSLVF